MLGSRSKYCNLVLKMEHTRSKQLNTTDCHRSNVSQSDATIHAIIYCRCVDMRFYDASPKPLLHNVCALFLSCLLTCSGNGFLDNLLLFFNASGQLQTYRDTYSAGCFQVFSSLVDVCACSFCKSGYSRITCHCNALQPRPGDLLRDHLALPVVVGFALRICCGVLLYFPQFYS